MCRCSKARFRPGLEGLEGRLVPSGVRPRVAALIAPPPTQGVAPLAATTVEETGQPPDVSSAAADAITDLTDVSLIKQGDTYYLFSSGEGITLRRSTDLVHWDPAGQVFDGVPAWALAVAPAAQSIWAPDISYFNGRYHLYYAVSEYGTNRSVIGLATSPTLDPSSPSYKWTDHGEVIRSRPARTYWNAIDPQVTFDGDSQPWLAFGSQWSGVKLARIEPQTGKLLGGARPRLRTLASRPDSQPIEAPFIFKNDGYYYLFVSYDRCCLGAASTYKIMVGRSTKLTGPYLDRDGKPMRRGGGTLVLADDGRYKGPGSNAVLSDGGQTYLAYHAYDTTRRGVPTLRIRRLDWDAEGWPVAGTPLF